MFTRLYSITLGSTLAYLILLSCLISSSFAGTASGNLILILDGSGSMYGRVDGKEKILIAKEVINGLIDSLPEDLNVGLYAYGHTSKGDCEDIESLVALSKLDKENLKNAVNSISPKGKTPITNSIRLVADSLKDKEEKSSIVLVSDGKETCEGDPCSVVEQYKNSGLEFTMHVIGFDVTDEEKQQLECIAKAGGGNYYNADNAVQLKEAVTQIEKKVVEAAPFPEPTPEPEPPSDPGEFTETEPNNIPAEANAFNFGDTVVAEIPDNKDTDYFKYTNNSKLRDVTEIHFENLSTTLAPSMTVYNQDKSKMFDSYDYTQGADKTFTIVAEPGAVYYFRVHFHKDAGKYKFSVNNTKAYDEFEPNDRAFDATKLAVGNNVTASIMDKGDKDWYKVTGITGNKLSVTFENGSTTLAPSMTFYNSKKVKIFDKYDYTPGADMIFDMDVVPNVPIYIQVHFHKGTGEYRLTVDPAG